MFTTLPSAKLKRRKYALCHYTYSLLKIVLIVNYRMAFLCIYKLCRSWAGTGTHFASGAAFCVPANYRYLHVLREDATVRLDDSFKIVCEDYASVPADQMIDYAYERFGEHAKTSVAWTAFHAWGNGTKEEHEYWGAVLMRMSN